MGYRSNKISPELELSVEYREVHYIILSTCLYIFEIFPTVSVRFHGADSQHTYIIHLLWEYAPSDADDCGSKALHHSVYPDYQYLA